MELSPELRDYLKRCGLSKKLLAQCSGSTRMYHDLGLYGDVAEAYMEALADQYHVDLSGFEFEKFFPSEFPGKNMLTRTFLWFVPFARSVVRKRCEYEPLTLEMIDRVLRTKQWQP